MKYCKICMNVLSENDKECVYCSSKVYKEAPAHHLAPYTLLKDRYLVGSALGEGGFGITYIGRDTLLDMKVAIKEYYPNGYVNRNRTLSQQVTCVYDGEKKGYYEQGLQKFLNEARIMAKFSTEAGIVNVRDFFEENDTAYIVMEYLNGEDLKDYLYKKKRMYPDEILELLKPVMTSLQKVHNEGLIHRDISPDNIRLVPNGVKLMDFGAARDITSESKKSLSIVLKPGYAPEEQYRSRGVQGPWTDVYALSATIYKCITGVTPVDSTQRVVEDDLKKPSELGIKIDEKFEKALMKGLSVFQKDRYQSIEDLLIGLNGTTISKGYSFDLYEQSNKEEANSIKLEDEEDKPTVEKPKIKKEVIIDEEDKATIIKKERKEDDSKKDDIAYDVTTTKSSRAKNLAIGILILVVLLIGSVFLIGKLGVSDSNLNDNNHVNTEISENVSFYKDKVTRVTLSDRLNKSNVTSLSFKDCELDEGALQVLAAVELPYTNCVEIINTKGIKNYKFISKMNDLEKLEITNSGLTDDIFTTIDFKKLKSLEELVLDDNKELTNISSIKNLTTNLIKLSISNTKVKNISQIPALLQARIIYAENTGIKDLTCLKEYNVLKKINFRGNGISDITPLTDLIYLTHVNLMDNNISDLSPLLGKPELEVVCVANNNLNSLHGLEDAIALKEIDASNNKLTSIDELVNMVILEKVSLDNNNLNDINSLNESKDKIKYLSLRNNKLEIEQLNYPKLKMLRLDGNQISKIDLKGLTDLTECTLSNNKLTESPQIERCVEVLDLSGNSITKFTIEKENKFKFLDLSNNKLECLFRKSDWMIYYLSLYGNAIKNYEDFNYNINTLVVDFSESLLENSGEFNVYDVCVVDCPKNRVIKLKEKFNMRDEDFYTTKQASEEVKKRLDNILFGVKWGYWYY